MAKTGKAASGRRTTKTPRAGVKKGAITPRTAKGNFGYPYQRGGGQRQN